MFFGSKGPHFVWDRTNLRKIAGHRVKASEVEEVFFDPKRKLRRTHSGEETPEVKRFYIVGRTYSGRLLKVPFEDLKEGVRIVTAFDAGNRDYTLYWRKR